MFSCIKKMKNKHFVLASSLLMLLLGLGSCSSEGELMSGSSDSSVPDNSNGIRIVVHTPAPDDIVMSRAPLHDEPEYTVKKLGVYLFVADKANASLDKNYILAYQAPALVAGDGQLTDNGNGSLSYTLPINAAWLGKSAKIALIANDAVTAQENSTTLAAFKESISTNKLSANEQSADIISGRIYATDATTTATGLPMTAMAKVGVEEAFDITPLGADLTASLQRIMARIDVYNNTPNLTITDMKVTHAAATGYLFSQENVAPADVSYYTLKPTTGEYSDDIMNGNGLPYVKEEEEEQTVNANTHKHVFYLYEQQNGPDASAEVVIVYKLTIGDKKVEKVGSISIPLKTNDGYINTTRNNLYTIKIGDGKPVQDEVNVQLIVNDWEQTTEIDGELNPGKGDVSMLPGDPKDLNDVAVGDYYLTDGTLRDGKSIPAEAYPYVIGVVFQTYKDAPDRFEEGMHMKKGSQLTPHALAMAVKIAKKKAKNNLFDWGGEVGDYKSTIAASYQDIFGLSHWNTVKGKDSGLSGYPAFKAVADFDEEVPAPNTSTGWFLPSLGQWWDVVENLGGFPSYMEKKHEYAGSYLNFFYGSILGEDPDYFVSMSDVEDGAAENNINQYLTPLGEYADPIQEEDYYWSSTESSGTNAYYVFFGPYSFNVNNAPKQNDTPCYVRAVLAF